MTIDEIKELIRAVKDTGIAELEVNTGESKVVIRNNSAPPKQELVLPATMPVPTVPVSFGVTPQQILAATAQPAPVAPPETSPPAPPVQAPAPEENDRNVLVKSPIVGTYYDAPSPGASPFVRVGDRVEPGQVLCVIESMKLMNEIEAEVAGVIAAKHVENGRPVEYGETLFTIRPV